MDLTVQDGQLVVDYRGTDYAFEVVGDDELEFAGTGDTDAAVPDEVLEALEADGYIVHP